MGAILVLSARRKDELERVRAKCGGKNAGKHTIMPLDMLNCIATSPQASSSSSAQRSAVPCPAADAARGVMLAHGRIDVLVNNAGRCVCVSVSVSVSVSVCMCVSVSLHVHVYLCPYTFLTHPPPIPPEANVPWLSPPPGL